MDGQKPSDLSKPTRIVEGHRRASASRRYARMRAESFDGRSAERRGEPDIDGLLARVTLFRQMREGTESLFEIAHSLLVGRPCQGFGASLPEIGDRLVPYFTPQGMMGKSLDSVIDATASRCLNSLDDSCMEHTSPLLEQTAIGDLMCQGMLKGIDAFGIEARLVQEFRRL